MVFSNTRIRPSLPNWETSFWSSPTSFMLSCRMSTALFLWYHCFSSEYAGGKLRWPLLYRYSAADLFFQTKSSGPCISGTPGVSWTPWFGPDYYAVCAQKSCNVWSVTEKRTASLILSAGIDTGTLHRTHGFGKIPDDRNTLACSHLYTETSFWICHHRAAGKDRSYEQQLLYELFQTEFRSRSHWISESGTYPISMRPSAQYGSQYLRHCFRYRIS